MTNDEHIVETFRGAVVIKHVATFRWLGANMFVRHLGVWRFRPWYPHPTALDLIFGESRPSRRFITPSELEETMLLDFLRSVRHRLDLLAAILRSQRELTTNIQHVADIWVNLRERTSRYIVDI